jgi:hypothetical protein
MIPTAVGPAIIPATSGKLRFHVIIDESKCQFFLNQSGNGIRLHYEMQMVVRSQKQKLRDTDIWADSEEAALQQMEQFFQGYRFMGAWASPKAD